MIRITDYPKGRNAAVITGHLNAQVYDVLRDMPGRKKMVGGDMVFEKTRTNIEYLQEVEARNGLNILWDLKERLESLEQLQEIEKDAIALHKDPELPPEAFKFQYKTQPMKHQEKAFRLARDREAFGHFLEQGLGKTKVILDEAAYLWSQGKIDTLLVLAPNGVHAQWVNDQLPIHLPDFVKNESLVYTSNHTKAFLKEVDKVVRSEGVLRVIAVHHQAMQGKKGVDFVRMVLSGGRCMWVIDESHCIKTPGTARTKAVMRLRNLADYRRILTGTPVTQGVEDLFTQLKFLHDDVHGFSSFSTFKARYCISVPVYGHNVSRFATQIVGYKNLDDLKTRMDPWVIRLTAKECLDLPERTYSTREVEITPEQRRLYRDIADEMITQMDTGQIVSMEQAITRVLRLQTILCGHLKDDDDVVHDVPTNRVKSVVEIIEQMEGKLVLWARFHKDIDNLTAALKKYNPVSWDGRTSIEDRGLAKQTFLNDPECRVFIGNQGAAGTGLDGLQTVCHTMVYFSNNFKASDRWQSEARLHRMGQQGTVNVIDLVTPNSVDGHILKALKNKQDVAVNMIDLREMIV